MATKLLNRITELALDRGCEEVWVLADKGNATAKELYATFASRRDDGIVMFTWTDLKL